MKLGELECTDYRLSDTHLYLNVKGDFATDLSSIDFSNLVITDSEGNTLQTYTGFELVGVQYNSDDETLQFDLIMGPYVKYATEIAELRSEIEALKEEDASLENTEKYQGDVIEDILSSLHSESAVAAASIDEDNSSSQSEINFYVNRIKCGQTILENVPSDLRTDVENALNN